MILTNNETPVIMEKIIQKLKTDRSGAMLQEVKNSGLEIKILESGKWQRLTEYRDYMEGLAGPVPLYNRIEGKMVLSGVGFYSRLSNN